MAALAWRGRGSSSKNTLQPLLEMAKSSLGGIILVVQRSSALEIPVPQVHLLVCRGAGRLSPYAETEAQSVRDLPRVSRPVPLGAGFEQQSVPAEPLTMAVFFLL